MYSLIQHSPPISGFVFNVDMSTGSRFTLFVSSSLGQGLSDQRECAARSLGQGRLKAQWRNLFRRDIVEEHLSLTSGPIRAWEQLSDFRNRHIG